MHIDNEQKLAKLGVLHTKTYSKPTNKYLDCVCTFNYDIQGSLYTKGKNTCSRHLRNPADCKNNNLSLSNDLKTRLEARNYKTQEIETEIKTMAKKNRDKLIIYTFRAGQQGTPNNKIKLLFKNR